MKLEEAAKVYANKWFFKVGGQTQPLEEAFIAGDEYRAEKASKERKLLLQHLEDVIKLWESEKINMAFMELSKIIKDIQNNAYSQYINDQP